MSKSKKPRLGDIWVKATYGDETRWYRIYEGTGDNLFQEDINDGYVDYLNFEFYNHLTDVRDDDYIDGGMILLKTLYQDMTPEEIIDQVKNYDDLETIEVIEIEMS